MGAHEKAEDLRELQAERPTRTHRGLVLEWLGVLLGPFAFLLHLQVNYALVPVTCLHRLGAMPLHLAAAATFALTGVALLAALRTRRRAGEGHEEEAGRTARARFMGLLGLLVSALFLIVMLAQWLPIFLIDPCVRV